MELYIYIYIFLNCIYVYTFLSKYKRENKYEREMERKSKYIRIPVSKIKSGRIYIKPLLLSCYHSLDNLRDSRTGC